ncbi:T9SS type A sorting domain-containing protein [Daejeonella sp.]|uniref:T9SS type A sorting domain-containing protein n=1 Tax=Daejeonella sp. TaxID=2805397 RepID=UPI0025B80EB2|nr:T9SS type A sorting domain-containing protein [Daejeonella sp.]
MIRAVKTLVLLLLVSVNLKGQTTGNWFERKGFGDFYISNGTSGDFHQTISFNISGTIYVGHKLSFSIYDPKLNSYIPKTAPSFISNVLTSFSIGNKGYVLARLNSGEKKMLEYNPELDQWTSKQQFVGNAITAASSFVINNKAYIIGGGLSAFNMSGDEFSSQVWEYNPIVDVFLRKKDTPFGSRMNMLISHFKKPKGFVIDNYGYILFDSSTFYQFDPITDNWYSKPAPNVSYNCRTGGPCYIFNSFSFKEYGYYLAESNIYLPGNVFMRYDPKSESWTKIKENTNIGLGTALSAQIWVNDDNFSYGISFGGNISFTPNDYTLYTNKITPVNICSNLEDNIDLKLEFTAKGNYNASNVFKLLLSDENGNFASPKILDSLETGTSDQYIGSFTKNFSPEILNPIKNYRLKVTASNPNDIDLFETPLKDKAIYYPSVKITSSGPTNICKGSFVTLSVPLVEGYSYQWFSNDYPFGGGTKNFFQAAYDGNYSVKVTNTNGCVATSEKIKITVSPVPTSATITASGPTTFCQGGSVTLTSSPGYKYLWSNGDTTQTIIVNKGGNYTSQVINESGCSITSNIIGVKVLPLPIATITAIGPTTFCQGGSVKLIASQGRSFLWSNGAKTQEIIVSESGNYSVTVTSITDNGCVATSAPTAVTVNTVTDKATITANGPTTFCPGGSVTLTASSGDSYLWSNGEKTQSIVVTNAGNYSVKVTNSSGCTLTSEATTISINPLPTVRISAIGPTSLCQGESVTLISSSGKSYLWSTGETTQSIKVSSSGKYTVKMTNENGCSNTSEPFTVTVSQTSIATVTASGPLSFCQGGSVTLTSMTGSSYLWNNGATTQSINVNNSGNYSVTVKNENGCSLISSPVTVSVNILPKAEITATGPTTFCAGGSVTLTSNTGSSYLWNNGATTQSINVNSAGNYSVTVKNENGCSVTSTPITVIINSLPKAEITASGRTTFCPGESVTLTASSGSSYLWSTGATSQNIKVDKTGNYSVKVTNSNGCSATSSSTSVIASTTPDAVITASGSTTITQNGNVNLSVISVTGNQYQWFKNSTAISSATSSVYKATSGGSYTVKVTNSAGCTNISSPVVVKSILVLPSNNFQISIQPESCRTSDNGKIVLKATENLNYSASLSKSGQSLKTVSFNTNTELSGLSAGKYTICITVAGQADFRQCFDVVITEPQDLAVFSFVDRSNNSLMLNMSGGDTYYVSLNDVQHINRSSKMNLGLKRGWNKIKISSDKECQGVYTEDIYVDEKISVFPNPFTSILNIKVDQQDNKSISVKVLDQSGLEVHKENAIVNNNLISIDLSKLTKGYYFVVIGSNTYKVIKK